MLFKKNDYICGVEKAKTPHDKSQFLAFFGTLDEILGTFKDKKENHGMD